MNFYKSKHLGKQFFKSLDIYFCDEYYLGGFLSDICCMNLIINRIVSMIILEMKKQWCELLFMSLMSLALFTRMD